MKKSRYSQVLDTVDRYYTEKVLTHGANFMGVDWNSSESQELRFERLLTVCDRGGHFSIIDYGCGYGRLFGYMKDRGYDFDYTGFDISRVMIEKAVETYGDNTNCNFLAGEMVEGKADYAVASGIFNVRLGSSEKAWLGHIIEVITNMDMLSKKGFSFNCLTKYSDKEHMKDYLYYADPCRLFDYCKRRFSRNVALFHDYGLYEFTIVVRK